MNICLVSREYPPATGWGGIGTYTYNLAHGLSAIGHRIHVISNGPNGESEYRDAYVHVHRITQKRFDIKGLWRLEKYIPIPTLEYSYQVAMKINKLVNKYDIDIVEAPEWGAEAFWYSFTKRTPLVIKLHTPMFLVGKLNMISPTINYRLVCWLEKMSALNADMLTSPSKALADIVVEKYHLQKNRVVVMPNPIDDDVFKPSPLYGAKNRSIMYVGRLEMRKGVHILADAISRLNGEFPNITFLFVGKDTNTSPTNGSMKNYILQKAGEGVNINFFDHVDRNQLAEYYQTAMFCVFPSLWENFPYTCLEAMACGMPVVASNTGGISEMIEDGVSGFLFKPGNVEDLYHKLKQLLKMSQQNLMKVGSEARSRIEDLYSRSNVAKESELFYHRIIDRNHRLSSSC